MSDEGAYNGSNTSIRIPKIIGRENFEETASLINLVNESGDNLRAVNSWDTVSLGSIDRLEDNQNIKKRILDEQDDKDSVSSMEFSKHATLKSAFYTCFPFFFKHRNVA